MIDYDGMRKTVVSGLNNYLGCPVIRSNQNDEPPPYPYVSYTITTLMGENKGTYGLYADDKKRKPFAQTWSISVQSNENSESTVLAIKAREWLDCVGRVYLSANGITVQSVGGITNRDNFITVGYEYKNGFDVVFQLMDELENTSERIETADLKQIGY